MKLFNMSVIIVTFAAPVLAGGVPHVGDVGVSFQSGRIVTTLVEEEELLRGGLGLPQRVFDSDLGTVEFGPFGNDEPGYTSNILPSGARIGFNIREELKRWNGAGFDGGIIETLQVGRFVGTPGEMTRETSGGFVPGFLFATADNSGFIDEHLSHILRGLDTRGFGAPTDGVYLLELELFTDVAGIENSEPYWVVFNLNLDQSVQDDAISFVEQVLIPAPSAAGVAALGGVAWARRRRR